MAQTGDHDGVQLYEPNTDDMPAEFADPEGDAELDDPEWRKAQEESVLEAATSTTRLRTLWSKWKCGSGEYVDQPFFGKTIGGIPAPAQDAYKALEHALRATGYSPKSRWAYNCRKIAGSGKLSLHSYGIAIDIDPTQNPHKHGDKFNGTIKKHHVDAVLAIKNTKGQSVWSWGGDWTKPDRMHFQLDQGPDGVDVDWSTVPEAGQAPARPSVSGQPLAIDEEENMLTKGAEGEAVKVFQNDLQAWKADSLPRFGSDGDFGNETVEAVKSFQKALGLDPTGNIDGVTAALLARHSS